MLRNTGTNHLMAIAGLHIGILAGLVHLFVTWCWRRFPNLMFRMPASHAGACGALLFAFFIVRYQDLHCPRSACMMLIVLSLAFLSKRKMNAWTVWSLALFAVLLLNPLSVLTESFWLSFGTIALIIYGMRGRLSAHGWWWKWVGCNG